MQHESDTGYVAPALHDLGSVAEFTQGGADGMYLDATYTTGTPRGSLTFS